MFHRRVILRCRSLSGKRFSTVETLKGDRLIPKEPAKIGVSFSPSGLLGAFHIGAYAQLREYGIITPKTALAGSSGGAMVALAAALDISPEVCKEMLFKIAQTCRDNGVRGTLGRAVTTAMESLVTEDDHEKLNQRLATFTVAFAEVYPARRPHFVNVFNSKSDLIDIIGASTNVPFYSAGNSVSVAVRSGFAVDGFFTTDRHRFGCPDTGATEQELIVCPFSPRVVRLDPYKSRFSLSKDTCKYTIISPDLLRKSGKRSLWPFKSSLELVACALAPPRQFNFNKGGFGRQLADAEMKEWYEQLSAAGEEAVKVWYNGTMRQGVTIGGGQ